ncbi:MAG TPA: DNA (cytosine-5-)-methyltransferase [Pirellulaceae bacterium]|nr:DNA (cytosine-5-)-methyltransferase [Pirellulaceae bacterium]
MSPTQLELWNEMRPARDSQASSLAVVGLFAGIGGIELGLQRAGHRSLLHCEIDSAAQRVLEHRFSDVKLYDDVRKLASLPSGTDLVAAGFPCQDLSQAGRTRGINGQNSGLVDNVFRLLRSTRCRPKWLLIENVPFMLQLDCGKAMTHLARSLEELGFSWAYRVVDARCFGLPQRRRRVILLASADADPREVLFAADSGEPQSEKIDAEAYGFYWTEGNRGLGWAVDAVPTLKGGSTIGIPSPPAIWLVRENRIVTPDIRDAERLQGFPADWTRAAVVEGGRVGARWKLVGNAVCVPVARWVGHQLCNPKAYDSSADTEISVKGAWPHAAWGREGKVFEASVSEWPVHERQKSLVDFLKYPVKPLSERAATGFLSRARASSLRFRDGFLDAVASHIEALRNGSRTA